MAKLDFKGWPERKQVDAKPFDRLMPFHRIHIPENQILLPGPPASAKQINGDGYAMGARSTKDYDAKFGEDLGRELAELVEKIFPVLGIGKAITHALAALIGKIPGLKPVADEIDKFDPLVKFFEFLGSNFDALLVDSFIRSIPAWVPTTDDKTRQVLEVEGILIRSHQRIDSVPFWQWHRWYDWRFAVCPVPLFSELIGFGNMQRDNDNDIGTVEGPNLTNYLKEGLPVGATISANAIAECEWDIGAIGMREGAIHPKLKNRARMPAFFDEIQPRVKHDWCWPMTGMFFWAIGRSVYDCAHSSGDNARRAKGPKKPSPLSAQGDSEELKKRGVHINQLHPLKAVATARWEAHQFKENPKPVPALQFMFYANIHLSSAGFFDPQQEGKPGFSALGDQDYDFIIDLPPPVVTAKSQYPVGHTPDFALNTLVLQPRLVVDAQFDSFQKSTVSSDGIMEDSNDRTKNELTQPKTGPIPIVQLIGGKPNEPPKQAAVRIPLKSVGAENNAYGVLLSVGWLDPEAVQATKVKKVKVRLLDIQPDRPDSDDDWNLNVGVNGRWFNFRFKARETDALGMIHVKDIAGGNPVEVDMLLSEDDLIMVSAHGFEEDPFDDLIRIKPEFPPGESRPPKAAPQLQKPNKPMTPDDILKFKEDVLKRTKSLSDRILRHSADLDVPTGPPNSSGGVPTTKVTVPFVGDEVEWNKHVDTDDDHQASLTARAMFLRLAFGNRFDANDLLGMLDANVQDPLFANPVSRRLEDGTDTANPLVVKDVVKDVGLGKPKACRVTAYKSLFVGRTVAMVYDPTKVDYTLHYEVIVDDLPEDSGTK